MERILARFRSICETHYLQSSSAYHVWPHAEEVESTGLYLADVATEHGITVDRQVLRAASWGHDALFARDPRSYHILEAGVFRFARSKEEVAGYFSALTLEELGATPHFSRCVKEVIEASHPDGSLRLGESKVLAGADLYRVGYGSYQEFLDATERLRSEAQELTQTEISAEAMARRSITYLGRFAARRVKLTPHYFTEDGRSSWHMGAIPKLCRLGRSQSKTAAPKVVVEMTDSALPLAAQGDEPNLHDDDIVIVVGREWERRVRHIDRVASHAQRLGVAGPMAVGLPAEDRVISLPSKLVNEVYVPIGEAYRYMGETDLAPLVAEWQRILMPHSGTLHLYETNALPSPPYKETGHFREVCTWLKDKGFALSHEASRPFGWEAVFQVV